MDRVLNNWEFTEYFKDVEKEPVRDNFVVIYELLDEMIDFCLPQTTENCIKQEGGPQPEAAPRSPLMFFLFVNTMVSVTQ
ncbi:hypothetical protein ANCCAN_00253 [Ancylostoma caninum]|uniref:Uncharacterized protein n=1 Tax=Ancylostoma caninum TaxID=29170 RepID=A0A368HDQ3_ANCCA|nr:hypothetical protein ANCCAN_00253 [Ancylostoma caninum]